MRKTRLTVPEILNQLEAFYGKQEPCWPSDPYLFLLWWYCGYPASDETCARGWKTLKQQVGIEPAQILRATEASLAAALKAGGISKAQALQRAQRELIEDPRFDHPAYWAPFLLIGNWL